MINNNNNNFNNNNDNTQFYSAFRCYNFRNASGGYDSFIIIVVA